MRETHFSYRKALPALRKSRSVFQHNVMLYGMWIPVKPLTQALQLQKSWKCRIIVLGEPVFPPLRT